MTNTAHPDPELPYAGTSGWSGSATSRERAERDDQDGTTAGRQARTIEDLSTRWAVDGVIDAGREQGLTWKELAWLHGWHHGQASGVLSVLHKTGRIARLTERRNRCAVYVLPEYVHGRETAPHGGKRREPRQVSTAEEIAALPVGTVLLTESGLAWQFTAERPNPNRAYPCGWFCADPIYPGRYFPEFLYTLGPFTVIWEPAP